MIVSLGSRFAYRTLPLVKLETGYRPVSWSSNMAVLTTDQARTERAREVDNAIASVRMEGLEPSAEAKALFQRYVDGELSSDDLGRAIDQLLDQEYGPIRLPGNKRTSEPPQHP
jgi:hypothetical protein